MFSWKLGSLKIIFSPSAAAGSLILWLLLSAAAYFLFEASPAAALTAGLAGTILHWLGELWHQLGHAAAARRTGYPMTGVYLWWVLGASLYPRDEPELPAQTHIQRALGGPLASTILFVISGLLVLLWPFEEGLAYGLAVFVALEQLLIFVLGAMLPLGFTDGGTIRYWWPRR